MLTSPTIEKDDVIVTGPVTLSGNQHKRYETTTSWSRTGV
jgi:hypothetical protein